MKKESLPPGAICGWIFNFLQQKRTFTSDQQSNQMDYTHNSSTKTLRNATQYGLVSSTGVAGAGAPHPSMSSFTSPASRLHCLNCVERLNELTLTQTLPPMNCNWPVEWTNDDPHLEAADNRMKVLSPLALHCFVCRRGFLSNWLSSYCQVSYSHCRRLVSLLAPAFCSEWIEPSRRLCYSMALIHGPMFRRKWIEDLWNESIEQLMSVLFWTDSKRCHLRQMVRCV